MCVNLESERKMNKGEKPTYEELEKRISELELAGKEAKDSETKFRELFLSMSEGMYLHEMIFDENKKAIDYRITEANPISEKHLGIKPADAIGKTATQLYHTNEPPLIETYASVVKENKTKVFEYYFVQMDKWFSISAFPVEKERFATVFTDITDRIKNELELKNAKHQAETDQLRLQAILDTVPDLVWLKDLNGKFVMCNKNFENHFGKEGNEIIGKTDYELVDKESADFFREMDQKALKAGKPTRNEELVRTIKDNSLVYLETVKTPFYGLDKQVKGILAVARDITERKQVEKELLAAKEKAEESDQLKSTFLANMSHEIRTPMNGILGFADLLNEDDLPHEQRKQYVSIISNCGNQLIRIIDDILEISRLETKQIKADLRNVCLNDLLSELFSIFELSSKKKNVKLVLKTEFSNDDSFINTDVTKLNKILGNLIENALRYTFKGYVEFGYFRENDKLVIYVKDTGIGIAKEKLPFIFDRFRQIDLELSQKAGGLGLGLSIARENTELIGGRISVESTPGEGTTFFVKIPFEKGENTNTEKKHFSFSSNKEKPLILIVEDEEINYLYLETLLKAEKNNYTILHAKNGKEALEICMDTPNIDLIFMDIKMPIMNGFDATEKIREINPDIPIIAQTAYSTPEDIKKAIDAGCDDFISKPIDKESFQKIIANFLPQKNLV